MPACLLVRQLPYEEWQPLRFPWRGDTDQGQSALIHLLTWSLCQRRPSAPFGPSSGLYQETHLHSRSFLEYKNNHLHRWVHQFWAIFNQASGSKDSSVAQAAGRRVHHFGPDWNISEVFDGVTWNSVLTLVFVSGDSHRFWGPLDISCTFLWIFVIPRWWAFGDPPFRQEVHFCVFASNISTVSLLSTRHDIFGDFVEIFTFANICFHTAVLDWYSVQAGASISVYCILRLDCCSPKMFILNHNRFDKIINKTRRDVSSRVKTTSAYYRCVCDRKYTLICVTGDYRLFQWPVWVGVVDPCSPACSGRMTDTAKLCNLLSRVWWHTVFYSLSEPACQITSELARYFFKSVQSTAVIVQLR